MKKALLTGHALIPVVLACSALFSPAVAGTACQPLVIPTVATLTSEQGGAPTYDLATGQPGLTMTIEFYGTPAAGTFDLASAINANYGSCSECVRAFTDAIGEAPSKQFFQERGQLGLLVAPGADPLPVGFTDLRLTEVTIDPGTFQSVPVPDGECYEQDGSVFGDGFEN